MMAVFKHDGVFAGYLAPGMQQEGLLLRAAVKKTKQIFYCSLAVRRKALKTGLMTQKVFLFH